MNKLSLWNISAELADIMESIEQSGGEIVDPEALEKLESMLLHKTQNIIDYIDYINNMIEIAKSKKADLDRYIKTQDNRVSNIKGYCIACMDRMGIETLDSDLYNLKAKKPAKIVVIKDEKLIPEKYKATVTTTSIDKNELKRDLKNESIPGCEMGDSPNRNLVINIKK